jgi:diguanylate cyclase (GGDEF)-like protein
MLQLFANVVRKTMRGGDIIGRLGGEEFVALLSGTMAETAVAAERIRNAFAAATTGPNGQGLQATVSVGVACGSPHAPIDMLIARADAALYRAKANGRNRVELSDEAVTARGRGAPVVPLRTLQPQFAEALPSEAASTARRRSA